MVAVTGYCWGCTSPGSRHATKARCVSAYYAAAPRTKTRSPVPTRCISATRTCTCPMTHVNTNLRKLHLPASGLRLPRPTTSSICDEPRPLLRCVLQAGRPDIGILRQARWLKSCKKDPHAPQAAGSPERVPLPSTCRVLVAATSQPQLADSRRGDQIEPTEGGTLLYWRVKASRLPERLITATKKSVRSNLRSARRRKPSCSPTSPPRTILVESFRPAG